MFEHWALIEADLQQTYGVDVGDGILRRRSYLWLMRRVSGLMSADTRIRRKLAPPEKGQQSPQYARRRARRR